MLGWAAILLLAACTTPPLNQQDPTFPTGTLMRLRTPVAIPAGSAGGYIRGKSTESRYEYATKCRLETRTVHDQGGTVEPDWFRVLGTSHGRESLTGPLYGGGLRSFNSIGDGPGLVYLNFYIYLESAQQPDVLRLKCTQLQDNDVFGTVAPRNVLRALGNTMTVES